MELELFRFDSETTVTAWSAVGDRVMGGVSASALRYDPTGHAVFYGNVSSENNGGFASVRAPVAVTPSSGASGATQLCVEVLGDGKRYKLNLRTEDSFDGVNYQVGFEGPAQEWTEVCLALSDFKPTFRGRPVTDAPPLDPGKIRQVGLMIADRQWGVFALGVRSIRLV